MSSIHYFQRYSQPENVATNNTLLLLSRLYHHSPNKFKLFLSELLDDKDLEAGIAFNQQVQSASSVPDASITQSSFKILIETKTHKFFNGSQLKSHLEAFNNEEYKLLLLLSPKKPDSSALTSFENEVNSHNVANKTNIRLISTTFHSIASNFRKVINPHEFELLEIIADYESYCYNDRLITNDENMMRVVTCGWTLEENLTYDIYYAKSEKGFSDHSYIGVYADKAVQAVGKIENIIDADLLDDGTLQIKQRSSKILPKHEQNIIQIIAEAQRNNGWDISKNHKFFCVDKFHETNFQKKTPYPLQGTKFFDLKELLELDKLPDTQQIADLLTTKEW